MDYLLIKQGATQMSRSSNLATRTLGEAGDFHIGIHDTSESTLTKRIPKGPRRDRKVFPKGILTDYKN